MRGIYVEMAKRKVYILPQLRIPAIRVTVYTDVKDLNLKISQLYLKYDTNVLTFT